MGERFTHFKAGSESPDAWEQLIILKVIMRSNYISGISVAFIA